MPYCPDCGMPVMGNKCQRCGWSGAIKQPEQQQPEQQQPEQQQPEQQQPEQQQPEQQQTEQKRKSNLPIIIVVIVIAAIVIIGGLFLFVISPEDNSTTTPKAAFSFQESMNTSGNYFGGIVQISDELPLSDCSVTIYDSSSELSASDGPPLSENTIQTGSGLSLKYSDINNNKIVDASDAWEVTGGASGDQIKLIYKTGDIIALYTLS